MMAVMNFDEFSTTTVVVRTGTRGCLSMAIMINCLTIKALPVDQSRGHFGLLSNFIAFDRFDRNHGLVSSSDFITAIDCAYCNHVHGAARTSWKEGLIYGQTVRLRSQRADPASEDGAR